MVDIDVEQGFNAAEDGRPRQREDSILFENKCIVDLLNYNDVEMANEHEALLKSLTDKLLHVSEDIM
ncbi:uncharacterized protein HKW66_Vig0184110 [Vigna angularis]|uniref:Uncharacterized protein n=1 Tax=Phaseolus angularis TaxID=3914 RepID=A0A8T0KZE4_PHAAN|nr:uncharacterized protein HKW66_Vig0184110 [Vigna angularis]